MRDMRVTPARVVTTTPSGAELDERIERVDWPAANAALTADAFDNGRSVTELRRSFENSAHVVFAWHCQELAGMARLLSDGVGNAYLVDVWTRSSLRRRGIASAMVRRLLDKVPGQHVGLQTDDQQRFYARLGFAAQPEFLSLVVGTWLGRAASDDDPPA